VATGRPVPQVPAFTLGVADTSPLQVAAAYAMFADHGVYCAPRVVTSVTDAAGHRRDYPPQCRPVVPRHVADVVTSVLRGVIDGPDPARTGAAASIGRPAAGKTGTTDDYSAGWFSGYTPQLAASVWTGDPRGGRAHPLVDVRLRGQVYRRVFGGDIAAHVWRLAMAGALRGTPTQDFAGAGAHLARG
jgi:membrane peptidoglycan carboxypeptidase